MCESIGEDRFLIGFEDEAVTAILNLAILINLAFLTSTFSFATGNGMTHWLRQCQIGCHFEYHDIS